MPTNYYLIRILDDGCQRQAVTQPAMDLRLPSIRRLRACMVGHTEFQIRAVTIALRC